MINTIVETIHRSIVKTSLMRARPFFTRDFRDCFCVSTEMGMRDVFVRAHVVGENFTGRHPHTLSLRPLINSTFIRHHKSRT